MQYNILWHSCCKELFCPLSRNKYEIKLLNKLPNQIMKLEKMQQFERGKVAFIS
jgi:hypothetical protein